MSMIDPDRLCREAATHDRDQKIIEYLKSLVAEAGGEWCGIQNTLDGSKPLLLFTSPASGSTLAISLDYDITGTGMPFDASKVINAVRKRIAESDRDFADRKISVKASILEGMRANAFALTAELDKILGRIK